MIKLVNTMVVCALVKRGKIVKCWMIVRALCARVVDGPAERFEVADAEIQGCCFWGRWP